METAIVRVAAPPEGMEAGAKLFVTEGARYALSVAPAAVPVPALPVVMAPVELTYVPGAVTVTFTVTVHDEVAGIVAPERATLAPPAAAVTIPVHPAPDSAPDGAAVFTNPAG